MHDPNRELPSPLVRSLDHKVAAKQAEWRSPAVASAVFRHGRPVWHGMVGSTDADDRGAAPTPDTQFRMGSITKTFTATLIMQCRDEGLLDLDDRLDQHLPTERHGRLTIRRMLSHLSGLQREPVGDVWERAEGPDLDELLDRLDEAEAVLPPSRQHHYSNLAYSLLGEIVARLRKQPWEEALQERALDPLGMSRTTTRRQAPYALGYLTDPYADRLLPEKEFPGGAFAPAAELWTTVDDLAKWGAFIADADATGVLPTTTVDEMCTPNVIYDADAWTLAWGLGFMLHRRGERVLAGHDGAMPGFLAGLAVRRPDRVGAVVLVNTSSSADPGGLAVELATQVLDDDPDLPKPWFAGPPVPPEVEELLGTWWFEGVQFAFSAREGKLEARAIESPRSKPPSVFAAEGTDLFRGVSGREHGELLRVARDSKGNVDRLYWATYAGTRTPRPFGT